jgi:proteasome activator subunit 4
MFYNRDPRRYPELVKHLFTEFELTDYNGESSLNAVKALCFHQSLLEEQNWKFSAWVDDTVKRVWTEIDSEHDEVEFRTTRDHRSVLIPP